MADKNSTYDSEDKCDTCGVGRDGNNDTNWDRHKTSCAKKDAKKNKSKKPSKPRNKRKKVDTGAGCSKLTKFFNYKSPQASSSLADDNDIDVTTNRGDVDDETVVETVEMEPEVIEELLYDDVLTEVKDTIELMIAQVSKVSLKCPGYQVMVKDMYRMIACHKLDDIDVIIENRNLHDRSCAEANYMTNNGNVINDACNNLQYGTRLQKLLECSAKKFDDPAIMKSNNFHLSHNQLSEKSKMFRGQKEIFRLKLLNNVFRYSKLCRTLELHERLLVLLSEHKVPRLQQVVAVAQRNGRGIGYIVTKVMEAIAKLYTPNPSQDDKDLAFIVLKFGGPTLLSILHRAGLLPHESTAYRMAKKCPPIISSVKRTPGECFENNVKISEIGKTMVSIKMDETYTNPVLCYNQRDNEACGACYQHGKNVKLELDTFDDCIELEKAIEEDRLHIPKECLCVGVLSLNENKAFQPAIIWPSCQKDDVDGTINIITEIQSVMKRKFGFPAIQICTDGDSSRRKVSFNVMVSDARDFEWSIHVYDLPLVDYLVGINGETFTFDPKHLAKRCWCMCLREKMTIRGIKITKKMLKDLLADNSYGVTEAALHPRDKQNVKSASSFLLAFIEGTEKNILPYNLVPIKSELVMMGKVFYGLLSFFVFSDASISEQLKSVSTASYLLYHLYRENKTSLMPSQLYHDLQATYHDCLFVCAKSKEYCPFEPCFLVESGTDPEERWFGNVRISFKGGNYSALDMVNSARATAAIDTLLSVDHPDWTQKSRTQRRLYLDYSNPAVWAEEKLTLADVNIRAVWRNGYFAALGMMPADDAEDLGTTSTTLRSPFKKGTIVGVKNTPTDAEEEDWSIEDQIDDDVEETAPSFNDEFAEMIPDPVNSNRDPFFMIEGKHVYKTTCLKNISSYTKLSQDRLRRVQGKSKYPGQNTSEDNDNFLLIGDAVLITCPGEGPQVANIKTMKKSNISVNQIKITNDLSDLKNHQLIVQRIDTSLINDRLYWSGSFSGEVIHLTGGACLPIKPSVELSPPDGMTKFYFEYGLLQDMGVHLQLTTTEAEAHSSSSSSSTTSSTQVLKKCCFQCRKYIPLSDMRFHVGRHILAGQLSGCNVCGFCGRESCVITLKKSRGNNTEFFSTIEKHDCPYYQPYGRKKKFDKRKNPCTNRLLRCPMENCLSDVWLYNMDHHFAAKHPGVDTPAVFTVEDVEKDFILK